jgi:tetratricopeptide (TPR) repeat protein
MKKAVLILLVFGLFFTSNSFAELVIFKSGQQVGIKIIEKNDKYIKGDLYGVPITYFLDDIQSIDGKDPTLMPVIEKKVRLDADFVSDFTKGVEFVLGGKLTEAEKHFKAIDKMKIADVKSKGILKNSVKNALAILELLKNGKITKKYGDYMFQAWNHVVAQRLDQAIVNFKKAIAENPSQSRGYANLGFVYLLMAEQDKALPYFQKAIELEPDNASNIFVLGSCYFSLGEFQEAKKQLQKAKDLAKNGRKDLIPEIDKILAKLP